MQKYKKFITYAIHLIISIIFIFVDQITKILAVSNLKNQMNIKIIPNVFELCYTENQGAAFGMFQGGKWFFLILTTIFLLALIYEFTQIPQDKKYNLFRFISILLFSGAIGNAIDRITYGYVRDFFYFKLINFPIFNVADCYVTISMIILIVYSLFIIKNTNDYYFLSGLSKLFEKKKK